MYDGHRQAPAQERSLIRNQLHTCFVCISGLDVQRVDGRIEDVMCVPNVSLVQLAALRKNLAALPGDTLGHEAFCEILCDTFGEVRV